MSDDLTSILSGLSLATAPIESKRLAYCAWTEKPPASLLNPRAIVDGDVRLDRYLKPEIPVSDLPIVRDPLPLPMTIQPYSQTVEPAPKPNLVLIVASLLHNVKDVKSAWKTLFSYDIIMPRRVLTTILANKLDEIEAYAWRPSPNAPLFIDRKSSYTANPGAIGMQFADLLVESRSDHFRQYGVFEVVLEGRLKIAVSGEIDAVDPETGAPIEIKTKPAFGRPIVGRDFDNWLQSTIGGVRTMITAAFTAQRGVRDRPVSFAACNVSVQAPGKYYRLTSADLQRIENGVEFLDAILKGCKACGKVYKVTGGPDGMPLMTPEPDLRHCTVDERLVEYVATMKW